MANRGLIWFSAGLLTLGMFAGMVCGAGLAIADDHARRDSATGGGSSPSPADSSPKSPKTTAKGLEPSKTPKKRHRADHASARPTADSEDDDDPKDPSPASNTVAAPLTDGTQADAPTADGPAGPATTTLDDATAGSRNAAKRRMAAGHTPATGTDELSETVDGAVKALRGTVNKVTDAQPAEPSEPYDAGTAAETGDLVAAAKSVRDTAKPIGTAKLAAPPVEQAVAAPTTPTLINVLGSIAWGLFDLFTKIVVGPPVVPAGLSVNAGRGKLAIDCGTGRSVDADWYYPDDRQPDKLIYFQQGFLANASVYNETLAVLADRNNAIVVAPSITSSKFDCYGCDLYSDSMHAAVANLFAGDRAALAASAAEAGYEGELPEKFVFAGQSAGTQLASRAAGHYYQSAPVDEKSNLFGVLLYDASAATGALPWALDNLPDSVPVLQIASEPSALNLYGNGSQALTDQRPGQFNGVQLIGGAHSDGFRTTKFGGALQIFVGLVFGVSTPENVEAVQDLSQGWITDMYAGTVYDEAERTGIYGAPGQVIDIPTDTGADAHAYVLPGPIRQLSTIEKLVASGLDAFGRLSYTPPPASSQ